MDGVPTATQESIPLSQDKPFASALSDVNCMAQDSDCKEPLGNLMEVSIIVGKKVLVGKKSKSDTCYTNKWVGLN